MPKTRKKKRVSGWQALDREAGKKLKKMEAKEGKIARKRLREFTAISPADKKTKWYY